jgi:hypothetical protein
MIDEAIGKILGMAMAYVASAMGMFVAYVNYRKRIVKADRIMTPVAWTVILVTILATVGGAVIVTKMAASAAAETAAAGEEEIVPAAPETARTLEPAEPTTRREQGRWPWVGIVVPAVIFLFATVVTTWLHRHFTTQGH